MVSFIDKTIKALPCSFLLIGVSLREPHTNMKFYEAVCVQNEVKSVCPTLLLVIYDQHPTKFIHI